MFVCSSINEYDFRCSLKRKFDNSELYFLNYLFVNKLICINTDELKVHFDSNEIKLLNESGNLFPYYNKIDENKNIAGKDYNYTKKEIMEHIKKEINEYFNENNPVIKKKKIRSISDYIDKKIKFIDLKDNLGNFPFKFFNIYINNNNLFNLDDLKYDTELVIKPNYPIVIDCLNEIFQECKKQINENSLDKSSNTYKSKLSEILEENFNDYIWLYRNSFSFYGCKVKEKIHIQSLLDLNDSDAEILKNALNELKNISDSILIIQDAQNARLYDTSFLKLIKVENGQKFCDLYLTQETIKKEAFERLFNLKLVEDKACIKCRLYIKCSIKIGDIYFSYVFDKNNLDKTTQNYCLNSKINYQIYDDDPPNLENNNIEPKITSKFDYPIPLKNKKVNDIEQFSLDILDIDYSESEQNIKEDYDKLTNFLSKKRQLKKNRPKDLASKIEELKKYVNDEFKNYEIEEHLINEYLMEKENKKLIGISYSIDNKTKEIMNNLKFTEKELVNLYDLMKKYNQNANILKIVELTNAKKLDLPYYDCCLLYVDEKNEKKYFDTKSKISYSLKDKSKTKSKKNSLLGEFYLIKFTNKNMISYD